MPQTMQNLMELYITEIQKIYGDHLRKVILYGSYARGDNTPESDVDIMIIIDDSEDNVLKYRNRFSTIAALLGMKYDVLLSVLFRDKGNFYKRAQYNPFYKNIVKEGVEWYGRDEHTLKQVFSQ